MTKCSEEYEKRKKQKKKKKKRINIDIKERTKYREEDGKIDGFSERVTK